MELEDIQTVLVVIEKVTGAERIGPSRTCAEENVPPVAVINLPLVTLPLSSL